MRKPPSNKLMLLISRIQYPVVVYTYKFNVVTVFNHIAKTHTNTKTHMHTNKAIIAIAIATI